MPFPLAAMAIMGGAKLFGGLLKKKGQAKQAKEQSRANEANLQANFESQSDQFNNREDDRLARTQGIAQQLQGARALSPEVIAAALQRRRNTARKGASADLSKGAGFDMLGGVADQIGDYAGAYGKGRMMEDGGEVGGGVPEGAVGGMKRICPDGSYSNTGIC
jgi:hypothetical protein